MMIPNEKQKTDIISGWVPICFHRREKVSRNPTDGIGNGEDGS